MYLRKFLQEGVVAQGQLALVIGPLAAEIIPSDQFLDIPGVISPIVRVNPHYKHSEVGGEGP